MQTLFDPPAPQYDSLDDIITTMMAMSDDPAARLMIVGEAPGPA